MEKITLTFLGTGSSIPTKKRNHTALLLSYKNENILLDCGEGTQRQFKYAKISPSKLSRVLITHWHGDHVLGLPGLLQTLVMNEYYKPLEIYGPRNIKQQISDLINLFKIKIKTDVREASQTVFETNEIKIEALPMEHGPPSLAYSFSIKDKLRLDKSKLKKLKLPSGPHLGKLQQGKDISFEGKKIKASQVTYLEKGRKVTIIMDTVMNQNAIKLAKDSDLLICESSFSKEEEKLAKEYKHLTSENAATIAKKSKSKALVLTHLSQRHEHNPKPLLEEAKAIFPNTTIVKDLDIIKV